MASRTVLTLPLLAVGGSRRLSPAGRDLTTWVAERLLSGGAALAVGCSTGADAAVMRLAVRLGRAPQLRVFTAFGPVVGSRSSFAVAGAGSCSDPGAVAGAAAAGARVKAWAGGGLGLSLPVRLANRTRAVAQAATHGGVLVCEGGVGVGSLLLVRSLATRGLPIWVHTVSAPWGSPPPIPGAWVRVAPDLLGGIPTWHLPAVPAQGALWLAA